MFQEMDKTVNRFDDVILNVIEPTQKMIDIVADEWGSQYENDLPIDLTPSTCKGLTQLEIDTTTKWLYKNN